MDTRGGDAVRIEYIDPERYRDLLELTLEGVEEGQQARKDAFFRPLGQVLNQEVAWFTWERKSDGTPLLCHVPEPGELVLFKPDESSL